MKAKHILPILVLLIVGAVCSQPISADEPSPHRAFLPSIPVNNGGCSPIVGDPPHATLVWVGDPYITVEILSPCNPVTHIVMRTFYQDAAHPTGVWTRWIHISEASFRIYMNVLDRTQVWVEFSSLAPYPYNVEVSVP